LGEPIQDFILKNLAKPAPQKRIHGVRKHERSRVLKNPSRPLCDA